MSAASESLSASRAYHSWYGGERRQSWATPPSVFEPLHAEYGFTLDGASDPGNGLLPRSSTAEVPLAWEGERVFCNPPWSNIPPFVEEAATADLAVLLVPARTNCRWFHRALDLGATVRFFKPKPKFIGAPHVSPVDCVLLVFGGPMDWEMAFARRAERYGTALKKIQQWDCLNPPNPTLCADHPWLKQLVDEALA